MMEVVVSISKLEALAAVDDDPDVGECRGSGAAR